MAIIGIDFGTTTCSVARWAGDDKQEPQLITLDKKSRLDPNIIKSEVPISSLKTMRNFKLVADQSGRGEVYIKRHEADKNMKQFKYDQMEQCLIPINNDVEFCLEVKRKPILKSGGEIYQEDELIEALEVLFSELYKRASKYAATEQLVVGLPLGYSSLGRERIINSLLKAKWVKEKSQIILFPEPLAIALRCGLDYKKAGTQRILVADHGGGTLDMCVFDLVVVGGDFHIKVLSQKRCDIAGNIFDEYLMDWIGQQKPELLKGYGVEESVKIKDYSLWDAVEESKINLSKNKQVTLQHPCPFGEIKLKISRKDLEVALSPGLSEIQIGIEELLGQAGGSSASIEKVFLAGGTARMPAIQDLFRDNFPQAEVKTEYTGAGILAQNLALVPKYKDLVQRLCESGYGIWDYKKKRVVTLVSAGTLVTPKTNLIQTQYNKINIDESDEPAPIIVFHEQNGRWEPSYQLQMPQVPVGDIEVIPRLDNLTGNITVDLMCINGEIHYNRLDYSGLTNSAPPVVYKGQLAKLNNGKENYFIDSIRDLATGVNSLEMAVGSLSPYVLTFNQYRISGESKKKVEDNTELSILRMGAIDGFKAINIDELIYKNHFIPLLEVNGKEFSIITPDEMKNHFLSKDAAANIDEVAATTLPQIETPRMDYTSISEEVKSTLVELISEEIDKAYERGTRAMKRELLTKYVSIKTKKLKIDLKIWNALIDEWDDKEMDELVEKAFSSSSGTEIYNLVNGNPVSTGQAKR